MKQGMADGRMRVFIAAMVFLFMLITIVQADARQDSLKTELRNNGISMKLVRLDRTDGFMFGLSFMDPQQQSFVIAPGLDRMFLVVAGAKELILRADGNGKMQIIQSTGDGTFGWCLLQALSTFMIKWKTCIPGDTSCYIVSLVEWFTDIISCSSDTTSFN